MVEEMSTEIINVTFDETMLSGEGSSTGVQQTEKRGQLRTNYSKRVLRSDSSKKILRAEKTGKRMLRAE